MDNEGHEHVMTKDAFAQQTEYTEEDLVGESDPEFDFISYPSVTCYLDSSYNEVFWSMLGSYFGPPSRRKRPRGILRCF